MSKHTARRIAYYEAVRKHTLGIIAQTEKSIQKLEAMGDEFADVFAKTRKRHQSLLDKIDKRIANEIKKITDA